MPLGKEYKSDFRRRAAERRCRAAERRRYMMIYADNAATTSTSEVALKAMMPYFSEIYAAVESIQPVC